MLFQRVHLMICIILSKLFLYCNSQYFPLYTCARSCKNMVNISMHVQIIIYVHSKTVTFVRIKHLTRLKLNILLRLIPQANQAEGICSIVQNRSALSLAFRTRHHIHRNLMYRLFFIFFLASFNMIFQFIIFKFLTIDQFQYVLL